MRNIKKALFSLISLFAVAGMVFGVSRAFFQDVETSSANTFTAGALDLKVDSTAHYDGMVCQLAVTGGGYTWQLEDPNSTPVRPEMLGTACTNTWEATDLGASYKFFELSDIKPGDSGENTVSLHVDNDAWLRLVISGTVNDDMSSTEPELSDPFGDVAEDSGNIWDGELRQNLLFSMFLDNGPTPGDPTGKCDNIQQSGEPTIISAGTIDPISETWNLADLPGAPYLKGGETACFGINWNLPSTTGNEVQTDKFMADMTFEVVQHRNNPTPTW